MDRDLPEAVLVVAAGKREGKKESEQGGFHGWRCSFMPSCEAAKPRPS